MKKRLAAVALLLFMMSCMEHPSGLPDPLGYDGLVEAGWNSLKAAKHSEALDYFQQAMEVDISRAEGFLGAGISTIYIGSWRETGRGFLQQAIQIDHGSSAVNIHTGNALYQDTLWTVIECTDPDLPADSLNTWLAYTADSGLVWVGETIRNYLLDNGLSTDLSFRLQPEANTLAACLELYNMQSGDFYAADSIRNGWIHFTVPMHSTSQGSQSFYYHWVMADDGVLYDFAETDLEGTFDQTSLDALAGRVSLEEAFGDEGSLLQAVACAHCLIEEAPDYRFGKGDELLESVFSLQLRHVVGCAASFAFSNEKFSYSWFLCRQIGYGEDLDPQSETFLMDLLLVLAEMVQP